MEASGWFRLHESKWIELNRRLAFTPIDRFDYIYFNFWNSRAKVTGIILTVGVEEITERSCRGQCLIPETN